MSTLPDWSFLPDDLRLYAQSQSPDRQALWAREFADAGYDADQQRALISRIRADDYTGSALAATAVLTPEQEEMDEAEFYADLIARQEKQLAERQAARAQGLEG